MKVYLNRFEKFLEDYDKRVVAKYGNLQKLSYKENLNNLKEWYGYNVEIGELGDFACVEMSEHDYTLFAIKYL